MEHYFLRSRKHNEFDANLAYSLHWFWKKQIGDEKTGLIFKVKTD